MEVLITLRTDTDIYSTQHKFIYNIFTACTVTRWPPVLSPHFRYANGFNHPLRHCIFPDTFVALKSWPHVTHSEVQLVFTLNAHSISRQTHVDQFKVNKCWTISSLQQLYLLYYLNNKSTQIFHLYCRLW